ncbi:MAG: glycosyltransferase family 2 protein, partial [Opitutae bacterium]
MENINPAEISAYVPSFNNEGTIEASVRSLLEQTIPPKEVYVIDDGSSDDTALIASRTGVEVLGNSANRGRGYTRAKAVCRAKHDLILCCDATNVLEPDFIMKTLPVFADPKVASISGHLRSSKAVGTI